jgi:rod shape-determining protein MreC
VRGRTYLVFLGIALAVVVLLNLPVPAASRLKAGVRDGLTPFQDFFGAIGKAVRAPGPFLRGSGSSAREKELLLEKIANLQLQLRLQASIAADNAELRRQLGFQVRHRYRLVLCEVVARGDASGWWETIRLSRGTEDGIGPNMAVMTSDGLVGRTTTVSLHTTEVLLISDPGCKIACKVEGVGSFGIVRGTGVTSDERRDLAMLHSMPASRMDYIHRDADIPDGTPVVTSEVSGVCPEGLPVGRIVRSSLDSSRLFRRADVIPSADLGRLQYVFVVVGAAASGARPEDGPALVPMASGGDAAGPAPADAEVAR